MGQHSDKARQALMDAAEELFAKHGIDAVSNRRITEHAGTMNHSAIAYHFGNRDELIHALLRRHLESMQARRTELAKSLGADVQLHDVIQCRIMPWIEQLDALPKPSWRARFLFQVRSVPSVSQVLTDMVGETEELDDLSRNMRAFGGNASDRVLRARSGILGHMVLGVCAEYEGQIESGRQEGTWQDVGYFLIDSVAGMISAPVTRRSEYAVESRLPNLV